MKQKAIEKLNEEYKSATNLSQKGNVVKSGVLNALIEFCNQNSEFAQAVVQSDKPISECIEQSVKGTGNACSDLEVYKKAVNFYFQGATVKFDMKIDLGDDGFSNDQTSKSGELTLSLDSLLDF